MRHRKAGVKLNRTSSHRDAMFRNMVTSLFKHERIRTTDVKAKELRRWADNLITLAKRGDLHARRQALAIIREKDVVHKLFAEATERYGAVSGGYTRIVKLGRRPGDAAPISLIELVSSEDDRKKKKTKKKKKAKAPVEKKQVAEKKEKKEVKEKAAVKEKVKEEKEDKAMVLESEVSAEDAAEKPEEKVAEPMAPEVTEKTEPEPEKAEDKKEDIGSKE
jgi:large subunit ribosomal protein L17